MSPLISHLTSPLVSQFVSHLSRLPALALRMRPVLRPRWFAFLLPKPARGQACVSATLPAGQAQRLMLRRGETLLVRQGRLWLTREGDPVDHVLWPGSGHVASVPQEVVIEAFGPQACSYERHRLHGA